MSRIALTALLLFPVYAQKSELPRHFFSLDERLTGPSSVPPRDIAQAFVRQAASTSGLSDGDLAGLYLVKEYRTAHNGVTHLVYKQRFLGLEVLNAEWVVNIDRDGQVINSGGLLFGAPSSEPAAPSSAMSAVRAAVGAVNPRLAGRFFPFPKESAEAGRKITFLRSSLTEDVDGELIWYGVNGAARAAWVFEVVDENGVDAWQVVVDAETEKVLAKEPLTWYQSPKGLLYEKGSPQPNPTPGVRTEIRPMVERTMQPLTGDPAASPLGWVTGNQTAGNNVIAGANQLGTLFLLTPQMAKAPDANFSFPLQVGASAPNPVNFDDAVTTNLFYWANRAHDLFYAIGFDEAAGNYQQNNLGRGGAGGDPMYIYSHFGAAEPLAGGGEFGNAFYSTRRVGQDGAQGMVAMFLFPSRATGLWADGALDAEVIVHEYTHGVSTRLVRSLSGVQGGAMGEAWSDFFALEFTLPDGAPPDGLYPTGEYVTQSWGLGIRTRPYTTDMNVNPLTYAQFGKISRGSAPEVHSDGEIWVEALWEMRAALIKQFGEKEGRRRVRLLVIDGMKLSPPAPSYVDARDAILLADKVDFNGASQQQIWAAFARRGLGVLAQSRSASTAHVSPSFDLPSPQGSMLFYEPAYVIGEIVRLVLQDANLNAPTVRIQLTSSSGDVETIELRRTGMVYIGNIATAGAPVTAENGILQLAPGDSISAYYVDFNIGDGSAKLITANVPAMMPYAISTLAPEFGFTQERALFDFTSFPADPVTLLISTTRPLPFDFPYFNNTYRSATVYGNGVLSFRGFQPGAPCEFVEALSGASIAPLWSRVGTGGRAQPDENVYESRTADSITWRWAGETVPVVPSADRQPVNFAITLYADGRIELRYGAGNKSLVYNSPSCLLVGPAIGFTNGNETFFQRIGTHDSQTSLENAPLVRIDPPFNPSSSPAARLETPGDGDTVKGSLSGTGVVYDSDNNIVRVDVLVDGVAVGRATTGRPRPDFCAQQSVRGCPNVGFVFTLAAGLVSPGRHKLRLRATNSRGSMLDFPDTPITITVEPADAAVPYGAIESPTGGAQLSGTVMVRGYAVADTVRVSFVDVLIDGVNYGRAAYGAARNDICGGLPGRPNCPNIGFTFVLETQGSLPVVNGTHTLSIRAMDALNRLTTLQTITVTVNNEANKPPNGVLRSPQPGERLKGTVRISGHAWDPDGRITRVGLVMDNVLVATVPYGRPRPDECSQLPDVAACPNIGFEMDYDTRALTNGLHTLGIQLTDDRGATVMIPNLIRAGMNVVIEN